MALLSMLKAEEDRWEPWVLALCPFCGVLDLMLQVAVHRPLVLLKPLWIIVAPVASFGHWSMAGPSLAETWEADAALRNRARQNDRITVWPNPQSIVVASMRAAGMNNKVLELTAQWWVDQSDRPASIPIGPIRDQAWGL